MGPDEILAQEKAQEMRQEALREAAKLKILQEEEAHGPRCAGFSLFDFLSPNNEDQI